MKNNATELVFILDRSGSMAGLEKDTIGGFNAMLKKQKEVEGECRITTVLFDNQINILHDRLDIQAIGSLTEKDYQVGGSTALLDAIGSTINKIGNVQKHSAYEHRASKVLFVIITDGEENSSREFSSQRIKKMIEHQMKKYNWEFIFLGANIDAVETSKMYGIRPDRTQNYHADARGVNLNFDVMSKTVANFRMNASIDEDWKNQIEKDFEERSK
jgi:uncharacterized protein YegL